MTTGRMSPSGPAASRNSRSSCSGSATWNAGRKIRGRQSGHLDRRDEDGHVAAVDQDGQTVGGDADHREEQPWLRAVEPQGCHEHPEGRGEERDAQLVGRIDALLDEPLRAEAQGQRQHDEDPEAQLDRQEVADTAARQQTEQHPDDGGDQEQRVTLTL